MEWFASKKRKKQKPPDSSKFFDLDESDSDEEDESNSGEEDSSETDSSDDDDDDEDGGFFRALVGDEWADATELYSVESDDDSVYFFPKTTPPSSPPLVTVEGGDGEGEDSKASREDSVEKDLSVSGNEEEEEDGVRQENQENQVCNPIHVSCECYHENKFCVFTQVDNCGPPVQTRLPRDAPFASTSRETQQQLRQGGHREVNDADEEERAREEGRSLVEVCN